MNSIRIRALLHGVRTLKSELNNVPSSHIDALVKEWQPDNGEQLATTMALALTDSLLAPPGNCISKLFATERSHFRTASTSELEVETHIELYWRCAMTVALMQPDALGAMARHHKDLQPTLSRAGTAAERKRRLVLCVLPRFSMSCITSEQAEANAKRRAEIEEIKKQKLQEQQKDKAEEEGGVLL